jgi:hypothetical protein
MKTLKPNWQIEIEEFDKEQSRANKQYYKRHLHFGKLDDCPYLLLPSEFVVGTRKIFGTPNKVLNIAKLKDKFYECIDDRLQI